MRFKAYREYTCFTSVTLKARSWDDATDILWDGMLRPKKCFSEYTGVNVYYIPPFMIEQWHMGNYKALSNEYTVIAECNLRLAYEIEAEDAITAKKIVDDYPSGVSEWCLEQETYHNVEFIAASTLRPLSAITVTTVDENGLPLEEQPLLAEDYHEVVMMIKDLALKWIYEGKEGESEDLQFLGSKVMTVMMNSSKNKKAKLDALKKLRTFNKKQMGELDTIIFSLENLIDKEY